MRVPPVISGIPEVRAIARRAVVLLAVLAVGVHAAPASAQEAVDDVLRDLGTASTVADDAENTEQGTVLGQVFDSASGLPLERVTVILKWSDPADGSEPRQEVQVTDPSGSFVFEAIPPGTYSVTFVKSGYRNSTMTGFSVKADELNRADFPLPPLAATTSDDVLELDEFVVTAETAGEMLGALELRTDSDQLLNILSAEDFSKFAAGDVAEALERVAGVNIVEGQFAIIRGLEDRYSSTLYNEAVVPSPDPDRQSVQLDLFPSEVVSNLVVAKTFSPELPSNSSGGAIDIITLGYPDDVTFSFKAGTGFNDNAKNEFLHFDGRTNINRIFDGLPLSVDDPGGDVEKLRATQFLYIDGNPVGRSTKSESRNFFDEIKDVIENDFVASLAGRRVFGGREFRLKFVGSTELDYDTAQGFKQNLEARPPRFGQGDPIPNPDASFPQCVFNPPPPCFITPSFIAQSGDLALGQLNLNAGLFDSTISRREQRRTLYGAFGFDLDDAGNHEVDFSAFYTQKSEEIIEFNSNGFLPGLDYRTITEQQLSGNFDNEFPEQNLGFDVATRGSPIARSWRSLVSGSRTSGTTVFSNFLESASFQRDRELLIFQLNGDHTFEDLPDLNVRWAMNWADTAQEEVSLATPIVYEPCGLFPDVRAACPPGVTPIDPLSLFPAGQAVTRSPTIDELGPGLFTTDNRLLLSANDIDESAIFTRVDADYSIDFSEASRFFVGGGLWWERSDRSVTSAFTFPVDVDSSAFPLNCDGSVQAAFCGAPTALDVGRLSFNSIAIDQSFNLGALSGLNLTEGEFTRDITAWHVRGKFTFWERADFFGGARLEDILIVSEQDPFVVNQTTGGFRFGGPETFPSRFLYFDRLDNPKVPPPVVLPDGRIVTFGAETTDFPAPGAQFNDQLLGLAVPSGDCVGTLPGNVVDDPTATCVDLRDRASLESLLNGEIDETRLLPSAGFTLRPIEGLALRGAWSQTVARPSFRELGYYVSVEPGTDDLVVGNPQLQLSDVESWDARVEYNWGALGAYLAGSYFKKDIELPIESLLLRDPSNSSEQLAIFRTFFNNPNPADVWGIEVEGRLPFDFLTADFRGPPGFPNFGGPYWLRYLSVGGNYTYIDAEVDRTEAELERSRELFGLAEGDTAIFTELAPSRRLFDQPEWIANIDLTFDHPDWGTRFTLAYFAISDRLDAAGSATRDATGLLTSFTLDRYVDAFDELRLTVSQEIKLPNEFGSLTLRFSAKNLTDSERCRVYDPDQTFGRFEERCFNVGRDYDLSLTYTRRF